MSRTKLTMKQQAFVEAYLGETNGNAAESARLAGYKGNQDTLKQVGAENLAKPYIKSYIEKRLNDRTNKAILSANEVLEGLSTIARNENEKTTDRIKTMELMGKFHKLYTDRVEQSGTVEIQVIKPK